MQTLYNMDSPKRAANLTVNSDLLAKAKDMHINISSVLELALAEKLRTIAKDKWKAENSDSIAQYNESVISIGVFSDTMREF